MLHILHGMNFQMVMLHYTPTACLPFFYLQQHNNCDYNCATANLKYLLVKQLAFGYCCLWLIAACVLVTVVFFTIVIRFSVKVKIAFILQIIYLYFSSVSFVNITITITNTDTNPHCEGKSFPRLGRVPRWELCIYCIKRNTVTVTYWINEYLNSIILKGRMKKRPQRYCTRMYENTLIIPYT